MCPIFKSVLCSKSFPLTFLCHATGASLPVLGFLLPLPPAGSTHMCMQAQSYQNKTQTSGVVSAPSKSCFLFLAFTFNAGSYYIHQLQPILIHHPAYFLSVLKQCDFLFLSYISSMILPPRQRMLIVAHTIHTYTHYQHTAICFCYRRWCSKGTTSCSQS